MNSHIRLSESHPAWHCLPGVLTILLALTLSAPSLSAADTRSLSPDEKRILVETVCGKIETIYPFKDIGLKTREGLLETLQAGGFREITEAALFSASVTERMEELSRDKHLDLYFDPVRAAELIEDADGDNPHDGPGDQFLEQAKWENYGFKTLRILDGQVGYLDLRMFFSARHAGPVAMAAMDFLSASNAVIIDLRWNGGGWDDMVTLLAGYFFDLEEPEMAGISRSTLDQSYFASMIPSFVPGSRMTDIPIYLLTSSGTASAAEAFSSILRHFNPNVLLVGQNTAGAENPVEYVALDSEFVLKIPCYEKIYFGTRPGWEGNGLAPDLETPVDQALETAHLHALEQLYECHTGETARAILQWGIDGHRARLQPLDVDRTVLESYSGEYGSTRIFLEGGELILQFKDQPQRRLLSVAVDYFVVEGRDDLRLRFVTKGDLVTAMERIYSDGYRGQDSKN